MNSSKCALCQIEDAIKKNTHYLTDALIRKCLNEEGATGREKGKKAYQNAQIAADPKNHLGKFARMLQKNDAKYAMGDMHFILNLIYKTDGTSYSACTLLQDLRTFVLSRYTDIILTKDFLHRLDTFIKTFRNEAAHTGMVSRDEALKCRDEVRGVLGVLVEGERASRDHQNY